MLLRTVYTISLSGGAGEHLDLPVEVDLAEGVGASLHHHGTGLLRLVVKRAVDRNRLEVVEDSGRYRETPDGRREPVARLRIRDDEAPEHVLVDDFISVVTFLTDVPLSLSRPIHEDQFVPETEEDREALASLGTDRPFHETGVQVHSRTFSARTDADGVVSLLPRSVGVRLYADAVKLTLDVAQFRELWRVLESAFAASDQHLVELLSQYPPARQLEFDEVELRDLLILRGRASHAQSKVGLRELVAVERECGRKLARLKNLVERVILTKKSWGYPTLAVEELAPLDAYVGRNGQQVLRATGNRGQAPPE